MTKEILFFLLIVLQVFLNSCMFIDHDCGNELLKNVCHPKLDIRATSYIHSCSNLGATLTPTYNVRLYESSDTSNYNCPDHYLLHSTQGIDVFWLNSDTLVITHVETTGSYGTKSIKLNNSPKTISVISTYHRQYPVPDESIVSKRGANVTIIKHSYNNAIPDTLLNKKFIDIKKNKIDLHFCKRNYKIPNILPDDAFPSLYYSKTAKKLKECDHENVLGQKICYEFNAALLVSKMDIISKEERRTIDFKYDKKKNVIEMQENDSTEYKMIYDSIGNLIKLFKREDGSEMWLEFIYEKP